MSTEYPIDITPRRLIEFFDTTRAICLDEIGRDPFDGKPFNLHDTVGGICVEQMMQGGTGESVRAWLHSTDEAIAHRAVPPRPSLETLIQFRGAMWPKLGLSGIPWGPRPNAIDNVVVVDALHAFDGSTQNRIVAAYAARYTHVPMGPAVDPGYHGQIPACDFRPHFADYLDTAVLWETAGVHVCHFLRPDRGVAGLEWTVGDLERELTPLFASSRAQALMQIVCLGWEPGPQYFYNNAWWVAMCQWMADVFPQALRVIHMVADTDAPVGQDDDVKGITNGAGWANVAPYLHGWLVQNAGYTDGSNPIPSDEFRRNFTNQFNPAVHGSFPDRFTNGYAGWPTTSAWSDRGLIALPGEYAAFGLYWKNFPDSSAVALGQVALAAGAIGFFDGG